MKRKHLFAPVLLLFLSFQLAYAQSSVSGKVIDSATGSPMAGVSIVVKGRMMGTTTNAQGEFLLDVKAPLPFKLIFSFVGYRSHEVEINTSSTPLEIKLEEQFLLGQEVVVAAKKIEESIMESPVSIEKFDLNQIRNTASDDYYRSLGNLKGVDLIQSSVNYTGINARGFNTTGNSRVVQFLDGIDTQVPSLNHSASNINGPTELDVESLEFLPGAASALYGPNAFNGVVVQKTKNPFEYQGISALAKFGVNHIDDSDFRSEGNKKIGPGSSQPMYEAALRFAKAFNDRFAFKVSLGYIQAKNWYGTTHSDRNEALRPAGFSFNPAADKIFSAGDEVSASLGLLKIQLAPALAGTPFAPFLPLMPNHVVARTGYDEETITDYDTKGVKASAALHYRATDNLELSYAFNFGKATTVINAAQRTPVEGFSAQHHKLELKSPDFFVRAYATLPDAGKAYSGDLTGVLINNTWAPHSAWFQQYALGYLTYLATQTSLDPGFDANNIASQEAAHQAARNAADQGRLLPGTPEFEQARKNVISNVIPQGSRIKDNTRMYHADAQYDFSKFTDLVSIQLGGNYRFFDLNSEGTLFADSAGNDITVQEYGAYLQATKKLFNDRISLSGSVRYDKNENFDAQINPRFSLVISPAKNNFLRIAYQSGFRLPTLQGQHVDFNAVSLRLLGGLPQYARAHNAYQNAYLLSSVQQFTAAVAQNGTPAAPGQPANLALLVPVDHFDPVKPEKIHSIEVGYRTLIADNLFADVSYYYSEYSDFIAQRAIRKSAAPIDHTATTFTVANAMAASSLLTPVTTPGKENTFSIYTNVDKQVSAQGLVAGVEYVLPLNFKVGANYNWNRLNEELGDGFLSEYNTPEHKFNITLGNRKITENIGFNIAYRWQKAFYWESTFAKGEVPSYGVTDAQVSYKLKDIKSTVKIGGSNIFNEQYFPNFGAPTIGAIYYVSLTFDSLLR